MFESLGAFLFSIFILLIIYLALREVVCWYFKINEMLGVLKSIDSKLDRIGIEHSVSNYFETMNTPSMITSNTVGATNAPEEIGLSEDLPVFELCTGQFGGALCSGCKKYVHITTLYYNKEKDVYYHKECVPENAILKD